MAQQRSFSQGMDTVLYALRFEIKGTLRESKDRSFDFRAAPADIELIEYPAAR